MEMEMKITRTIQIQIQFLILILILSHYTPLPIAVSAARIQTYDVRSFGAKPDGRTDCSRAFLRAWAKACAYTGPAVIYVSWGRYHLGQTSFEGRRCMNKAIEFRIEGTLAAPSNYEVLGYSGTWLQFVGVGGVSINGGTLDGGGSRLWNCKMGRRGGSCPHGAMSLAFYDSNNVHIDGLTSINPQFFHVLVDGCRNASFTNMKIHAPANSPNTDGIHVNRSTRVTITNSHIGTGDDCISIGPGTFFLWIEKLTCGPGHGISIGSLGWVEQEAGVQNVMVKSVVLSGTQNGVRIKSWARHSRGFVRHVIFKHISMVDVQNPIFIDQNYCPSGNNCPIEGSTVRISDVTYQDIKGTSATRVAVKLECSKICPCTKITLNDVCLTYGNKRQATSSCDNARGVAYGHVSPTGCL